MMSIFAISISKRTRLLIFVVFGLSVWICRADPVEETIEKTYPLDPAAKVSISNADGSIWIYGSSGSEMKVEAIKRAYSRERLDKIGVEVSVKSGEASITTQYPPQSKWGLGDRSGAVDYFITLPWTCTISRVELANGEVSLDGMRGSGVHAELGNGRFYMHNCFTDVHVNVATGAFDMTWNWWEDRKFSVDAKIVNGNGRARIPAEAAFHLFATSLHGKVASDYVERDERDEKGARKIDIVIGSESKTEIRLQAINGNINVMESAQ